MEVLSQLSYVPKIPETRLCGLQIVSDPIEKTSISTTDKKPKKPEPGIGYS
jgi:hypothetical protein